VNKANKMEDRQIKEILIRDNTAFQDLNRQHQECDRKLEALKTGNMKTDREWVEERVVYYLENNFALCWDRGELVDFIDKEIAGRKESD